ncbi:MAG: SAM-dependent methyltransferase [Thiotrichales bacterium]|nr:SAM-dependent methyltransferase [Thiotrichales bacterium]
MANPKKLPIPTDDAKALSEQLTQKIRTHLKRSSQPMRFSQFMEAVLYTPNLGYYSNSLPKIGSEGDFITAPEVSPIFSRCLARQAKQALEQLSEPNIVEFGAGRGRMAGDILRELERLNQPLERYYIIEISAELQQQQQAYLQSTLPQHLFAKLSWLSKLPSQPIRAVVLANELLDAMPFERLRIEPDRALQAYVTFNEQSQRFDWDYQPITEPSMQRFVNQLIKHLGKVSDLGYETEINLNIGPWLKAVSDSLSQGLVLLIDYGYSRQEYYQPARVMGTLRCHYQHRAHQNPFFYPGLQDITAHVDFTAVAEAGFDAGFKIAGYTTQAHFLMGSGLLDMAIDPDADITEQIRLAQQIKTLTLPDEMGETFKVMALTKQLENSLMGFSVRDLRHQL